MLSRYFCFSLLDKTSNIFNRGYQDETAKNSCLNELDMNKCTYNQNTYIEVNEQSVET